MSIEVERRATLDDLMAVEGKAELIGGRIIRSMPNGLLPSRVAARTFRSLDDHAAKTRRGVALPDGVGYATDELPSGRESFCPDASYYDGPLPKNLMKFIDGPPTFAAAARSECDYRPGAEEQMAAKRDDYFRAGTKVVWDVDTVNEIIYVYRASHPTNPTTYRRGDQAEAEPAVPGWRVSMAELCA